MDKKTKGTLSEKEEKLLGAYFDGELSGRKRELIASRLEGADFKEEFDGLREVRQSVRGWMRERATKDVDIWSAISSELQVEEPSLRGRLGEFFQSLFRAPVLAGGFAAAALVVMLNVADSGKPAGESLTQVAKTNQLSTPELVEVRRATPLEVPRATLVAYRKQLERNLSRRIAAQTLPQVIDRNFILGGLRSGGGADIDWVRTKKPFAIYPSEERDTPPVIWVARANSGSAQRPMVFDDSALQ